jgi:hypothetical protein
MDYKEKGWESMNWIHLLQGSNQWQFPMNMIMNLGVP